MPKDIGYYIVELVGTAKARKLSINIGVNATNGKAQAQVSWDGEANGRPQFVNAPTTGEVRHGGFGQDTIFLALQGEATVSFQPAMVIVQEALIVNLTVDDSWKGQATLSLNNKPFAEVAVKPVER